MDGYARFVLAGREFGYEPFHGYLFDPMVSLGSGSFFSSG